MGMKRFFKKELYEIVKTYKVIVIPSVFLAFGLLSPLLARYMPEILMATVPDAVNIELPEPVVLDAYDQLFKNLNQIALLVMVLTVMGTVVGEKIKGTAILVLTKSVSRFQFIISKFLANGILFTLALILAYIGCMYYTSILFSGFYMDHLWLSFFLFWLYGMFLIVITIFASTISGSHILAAVLSFMGYILVNLLAFAPVIGRYSPGALGRFSTGLLNGSKSPGDVMATVLITLLLSGLTIGLSVLVFEKQEL